MDGVTLTPVQALVADWLIMAASAHVLDAATFKRRMGAMGKAFSRLGVAGQGEFCHEISRRLKAGPLYVD